MKNITKFLGIIAAVAVIGFVTGCGEPDAADRIDINISGVPDDAKGFFAQIQIYTTAEYNKGKDNAASAAISSALAPISGNTATGEMVHSGKNFADEGSYYVRLAIYENTDTSKKALYDGWTRANQGLIKGNNPIAGSLFDPPLASHNFPKPPQNFFGNYTGTGALNKTETIQFTQTTFKISDSPTRAEFLDFEIRQWDAADVPATVSGGFTKGYKFTGVITGAAPTTDGNLYGSKTAPGFVQADLNTTSCHMFIYMKQGTDGKFQFVRTTFTKDSNTTNPDEKVPVTQSDNVTARLYTQQ